MRTIKIIHLIAGIALAAALALLGSGCDFLRALGPSTPHLLACGINEAEAIKGAIEEEQFRFDVILDLLPCVPDVINAIERSDKIAGPMIAAIPARTRQRIAVVRWFLGWKPR